MGLDEWTPHIEDDGGYRITHGDLRYLELFDDSVVAYQEREIPLGLDDHGYKILVDQFWDAVKASGLNPAGVDARIKGSATSFYSGPHKEMPYQLGQILSEYDIKNGEYPKPWIQRAIQEAIDLKWPPTGPRPLRRPFNAMHRLGIHRSPSDIDMQICSDDIWTHCLKTLEIRGWTDAVDTKNKTYQFINKKLFNATFPMLDEWRLDMTELLRRDVSIAAFEANGPPDVSNDPDPTTAALSSHLDDARDWKLPRPEGSE